MADPKEPKPPRPGEPGQPLPRLWKTEPDEPEPEETPAEKKKRERAEKAAAVAAQKAADEARAERLRKKAAAEKKKAREAKANKGKDEKGALIEDTPELDTYETRQRVRIAVGAGLAVVGLLAVGGVVWMFAPERPPQEDAVPVDMLATPATTGNPRERAEQESRILFERARDVAKNGKADLAVALLKKVTASYSNPPTRAAVEAKEALDRPRQNLPLFPDGPAVVATPATKAASVEAPRPPERVVQATRTAAAPAVGAEARLVPPVNPPEPNRMPGSPSTPAPATADPTATAPAPPAADPTPAAPAPAPAVVVVTPSGTPMRALPPGFRPQPGTSAHASGWPLVIVGDRDGAPMVLVPGDTFTQGRDDADPAEGPAHRVRLATYYIDRHEVTVRQFHLYQKEAGKRAERLKALARDPNTAAAEADDERPVVMVTAREASDYSYWAGKRLPTEAQWEAAARTTDGRIYPWGPEPPAWSRPRAPRQIDPVMSFPLDASPYGACDLAGNAAEWTKDWFDPRYYQQFRTAVADNPTGPVATRRSQQLVIKGVAKDWRVSRREGLKPEARLPYLGFRCALTVEGPGNAFEPPAANAPAVPSGAPVGGAGVPF